MVRKSPAKPHAAEADVLFLLDAYDASTICDLIEQQEQYVLTLTTESEPQKKKMIPDVQDDWDPASVSFHGQVAEALAATNKEFPSMEREAVIACTIRAQLEIEARKMRIDTAEMQAGLRQIKQAIMEEPGAANAGGKCNASSSMERVAQVQVDMSKTLEKLVAFQAGTKAEQVEEYDHYGGKKGGALGMVQRHKEMGHEKFLEWFEEHEKRWKEASEYDDFGAQFNSALETMRLCRNMMRREERQCSENPTDQQRGVVAHVRERWVEQAEEVWVLYNCWKDSQEGEVEEMKKVWKDYRACKYGETEDAALKKLKEAAKKHVGEKRMRNNDVLLRQAVLNGYEVQRSRKEPEMVLAVPDPRDSSREVPPPRNKYTYTQLMAGQRKKVEEVLLSPPPEMVGKYVTVTEKPMFTNAYRNLATAHEPGYKRVFATVICCRECGRKGHEAWECHEEYEFEGLHCIPPLLLFPQFVTKTGQIKSGEKAQ